MYVKSPVVVRKETETPKCRFYGQVTVLSKVTRKKRIRSEIQNLSNIRYIYALATSIS